MTHSEKITLKFRLKFRLKAEIQAVTACNDM
jgi:hypothetical protein